MGKNSEPDKVSSVIPLTEDDPMPFGKHRGRPLCCVPASYLLWFFEQDWAPKDYPALFDYVEDNYDELQDRRMTIEEQY